MTQIWANHHQGDKVIAFANATIYKANPKEAEEAFLIARMQANDFSDPCLFSLPLDYVKQIHLQEGKEYIQVFFGIDAEEHFVIPDKARREEIFHHFKTHIPGASYEEIRITPIKAARKPMIGLAIIFAIFIYSLSSMAVMDKGGEVVAIGRIGALILGLTSLGLVNVLLIYGALIGAVAFTMLRKMKNPPVIHVIHIGR
ncbi:hypothetical protein [Chitinophaga rhizophila]|uniref:Uncharacterized protein n=1 Tax=Chitinophaga rhizophila TaxID=2866212 RepID=A0ABS7G6A6_9BACT|nr:hypothetical protein [Chitinophaga rhizophila]MBW8683186.1 hypothetical protein [Chitinophaga rhizophila]